MSLKTDEEVDNYVSKAVTMIEKYDPKKIPLSFWRLQFLTVVKQLKVSANKKSEFLCSMLEPMTNRRLQTYLYPRNPENLPYEEVVEALTTCPLTINLRPVQKRPKVHKQQENESIEIYARRLKNLCKGSTLDSKHDTLLNYHFLNGLQDRAIATYLKRKNFLSFEKAKVKAILLEKKDGASTSKSLK
ncbi:hypothetical protein M0804_013285 [Polistes exclamans]|nr:hypothetical protein M0804_013285 [Polistes exclamans]